MSSAANKPEPFGYFRATPFGWEDCAATDDGAQAMYDETAISTQASRIAELEAEIANLHTTMMAAAVEIQDHWDAHCDAEGYGPANLMHRLERGIASQYGYDAKTLARVEAERDQLRAEVERLRKPLTAEQVIAIKRATKAADPTKQWGDTLAFARAIEAAKEAK